jgi:putative acetyltransferase
MADSASLTAQVVIRPVEPEDFGALRDIYAQPRACHWTLQMPFPSAELWRGRLANPDPNRRLLAAWLEERLVGNIGLVLEANPRRRHAASIGMGVHDDFAGRGVGRAMMNAVLDLADNWLGLTRLELTVFADNQRAIRLYEGCGFETEGRFRQYAMRDGVLVDALAMARLR